MISNNIRERTVCLLFGIKESDDEESVEKKAIEVFKESLNLDIGENEIEIAHRIGKFRQEGKVIAKKARPVLIKFLSHKTEAEKERS